MPDHAKCNFMLLKTFSIAPTYTQMIHENLRAGM